MKRQDILKRLNLGFKMLNLKWVANLLTFALMFCTCTLIIVAFWILAPCKILAKRILTFCSPN